MVYALRDDALKFYRDNISGKVTNWGEIVQIMIAEFNPPIRREAMFNRLIRISLQDVMVNPRHSGSLS